MSGSPLKLAVVVGSVRDGRVGPSVARWFVEHARRDDGPEIDLIDLADHPLPADLMTDRGTLEAHVADLTARLGRADGFVIVTPEYNHSYPASLKQAIDWHHGEWAAKPVALVSYGGRAGGVRAAEHLRSVFPELHAMTVRDCVSLHGPWWEKDADGAPDDPGAADAIAGVMAQLEWWALALRTAREEHGYAFA